MEAQCARLTSRCYPDMRIQTWLEDFHLRDGESPTWSSPMRARVARIGWDGGRENNRTSSNSVRLDRARRNAIAMAIRGKANKSEGKAHDTRYMYVINDRQLPSFKILSGFERLLSASMEQLRCFRSYAETFAAGVIVAFPPLVSPYVVLLKLMR